MLIKKRWPSPNNCPILERTGDNKPCGRCWFALNEKDECPRHGYVGDLKGLMDENKLRELRANNED